MKKLTILYPFLLLLFLASCKQAFIENEIVFKNTAKKTALIKANNDYTFKIFNEINNSNEDNYMVSPVSLSFALGMLYNGSEGITKEIMATSLGYDNFSLEELSKVNYEISSILEGGDLKIANSNWIRKGFDVKENFLNLNKTYYNAEVNIEDFSNPQTVTLINNWVAAKTNNKIKTIVDEIADESVLFLINAIYFKANWSEKFDEKNTKTLPFYLENNTTKNVSMMFLQSEKMAYFQNEYFQSVKIPYEGEKYTMTVLVPKTGKNCTSIVDKLTNENWEDWQNSYSNTNVNLSLPKFKFDYKKVLNNELSKLGLENLFGQPNLSGISNTPLKVSQILQKTFIDVNEKGTEAAAVTSIDIRVTSMPLTEEVNCNKPFLFIISEKQTGSICFMGKVGNPTYED